MVSDSLTVALYHLKIKASLVESGSMQIVCPHCSTSYGVNPASRGEAGRNVRCSRCKEMWLARPEDAVELVDQSAVAAAHANQDASEWEAALAREESEQSGETLHVESPSIAGDYQDS